VPESINKLHGDVFHPGDENDSADGKATANAARKKAMDFLARREYGSDELIGRLKGAGFEADLAISTVETLTDEGLQDDRRFAEAYARSKLGRGSGPLRIRQVLLEKGLTEAVAETAVTELEADWCELARQVRAKKFGLGTPADFKEKARQMRFLQYRGFSTEQINAAMGAGDRS